jgi:hypothetical protein
VRSVLASDFGDYELVVVDDGSTDGTVQTLAERFNDPRLRVIALDRNRGMSEARRVGSEQATGRWVVILDSDWELEPFALSRMADTIERTPPEVRVLWFRVRWDDGEVSPPAVPSGIVGYEEKLIWWESGDAGDALKCMRREVFEGTPYAADRRGAMDTLYELDLAQHELAVYSEEVMSIQYSDAPNSWLRNSNAKELIPRLRGEAPDMLWMAETALARHGAALARLAPTVRLGLLRTAAVQAFILGQRRRGVTHARAAVTAAPQDLSLWATIVFGILGPSPTLGAIFVDRQLGQRRRAAVGRH